MANDLEPLVNSDTIVKVSSTLDKSVGKKNLTDGDPETCWTSQQGLPQFVQLTFGQVIVPKRVSLVFQGGFVGTRCSIHIPVSSEITKDWQVIANIYPEDVNKRQVFDLQPSKSNDLLNGVKSMKLIFEESSDFFGRITIYDLQIEGTMLTE